MVESTSQTIATVERAADVLLLFAKPNNPHLGVTDIAEQLTLSKAAVHRILASLRSRGFIELIEESRRYQLGAASLSLGVAYAGGSSKAFLAFLAPDEQVRYLAKQMISVTDKTIIDAGKLREELAEIRQRGFASSFGERQAGAASLAAPVFDHTGSPAAVISLSGPADRFKDEIDDCVPLLLAATARVSRRLGYNPIS